MSMYVTVLPSPVLPRTPRHIKGAGAWHRRSTSSAPAPTDASINTAPVLRSVPSRFLTTKIQPQSQSDLKRSTLAQQWPTKENYKLSSTENFQRSQSLLTKTQTKKMESHQASPTISPVQPPIAETHVGVVNYAMHEADSFDRWLWHPHNRAALAADSPAECPPAGSKPTGSRLNTYIDGHVARSDSEFIPPLV